MIVEAHTVGQDDWTTLPDTERPYERRPELRPGVHRRLEQPGRRGQRAASVPDPLPDVQPGRRHVQRDRQQRALERRDGPSGGLAAVVGRPGRLRRQPGRGLDHRAERLGLPAVPGRVRRRHRGLDRRGQHLVRDDADPMDGWAIPGAPQDASGSRARIATTGSAAAASASRRARRSRRRTRSTWASASRASAAQRPATR